VTLRDIEGKREESVDKLAEFMRELGYG